jgi:hypothetical protein
VKLIVKVLALFVLLTSVASAWDPDNCGYDLVFDSAGAVSSHDDGSPGSQAKYLCGHCGHLGSHLLGQVTDNDVAAPHAMAVRHNEPVVLVPLPSLHSFFRPPRNSLSV